MPKRAKPVRKHLTKTVVDAAGPLSRDPEQHGAHYRADYMVWDTKVTGFGLQVKPSGHKSYVYQYRNRSGRVRRLTLGAHGDLTVQQARKRAEIEAGEVRQGRDPVEERQEGRREATVSELADRFLKQHVVPKRRPRTIAEYRRILKKLVLPRLGRRKVRDLSRTDVSGLHTSMSSTPYMANRTLAVMSKMFNLAEWWGLRESGSNPCAHVEKYPEQPRKRRLSPKELGQLGEVLETAEEDGTVDREAAAAIRLLLFTGCRLKEILTATWENVDLEERELWLPESKTGARSVMLTTPALGVLASLLETRRGPYVIPGKIDGAPRNDDLRRPWLKILQLAGLEDVRLHDLRHTHGSVGGEAGLTAIMIAKLLGHKQISTTERYVHPADDPVRHASETVANEIEAQLARRQGGEVVQISRKS